jgi:hypothetical protein
MNSAELLRAWIDLARTREDLRFTTEIAVEPGDAPDFYPPDARALAGTAGRVAFSYAVASDPDRLGSLFLDLSGQRADLDWMNIDGEELSSQTLEDFYELELDRLGTGQAGWYWMAKDGTAKVVYSLEQTVVFDSLEGYLRAGAAKAFGFGWQWGQPSPLAPLSLPTTTPLPEIVTALVGRGATPEVAEELVAWLGADAALLVPAERRGAPESVPELPVTLLSYRPDELPVQLRERFALTDAVRRCLFWATRGGPLPVIDRLVAEIPEASIEGMADGVELMQVVGRLVATATAAHIAVQARGSFSYGFHTGEAAEVEGWLRSHEVTLVPLRPFLNGVLIVEVRGLPADAEWIKCTVTGNDWASDVRAVAPGLFAFDREEADSASFALQRFDGSGPLVEVRAAEVPPGTILTIEL